ncbi:MAG: type II toxin-antitoxin system VapC family toxin [Chloroflexi bacterium]|nr:type II toxin-antitoxin system VapC family toxin [Chloroflexota bacterium]
MDTDWAIQALDGREPSVGVLRRLGPRRIALSVMSVGELEEGAYHSANPDLHLERFRRFVGNYELLLVDETVASHFAVIRAYLRRTGQMISDVDVVVAATALVHDLTVLTFNRRHFSRIPELRLYDPT